MPKPGGGGDDLAYKYGNTTTGGASGGAAGGIIGGIGGIGGTVLSSISAEKARKTKAAETGHESEATWRAADRQQKSSVTNAVSSGVGVGSTAVGTTAAFSQIAANAGASGAFATLNNLLGGIAGIIALPIQALSTARTVRKAAKQWTRVTELRKKITNPEATEAEAKAALKAHSETIPALESVKQDAETELAELRMKQTAINDGLLRERGRKKKDPGEIGRLEAQLLRVTGDITPAEQLVQQTQAAVDAARVEETRLDAARQAAEKEVADAHDRIRTGKEGPNEIAAYALNKNKSGFFKKVTSAVGGFLGIGGGIAATVASFAAIGATTVVGTAVIATPVGWALCGAAALIALGLGGFAFWKWASKRYGRARKQEGLSKGKAFLAAINPFKKVGTSERERLAKRLHDYAAGKDGTPADMVKAKDTIKALGLDFDGLKMSDPRHEEASLKLIHDKMAS